MQHDVKVVKVTLKLKNYFFPKKNLDFWLILFAPSLALPTQMLTSCALPANSKHVSRVVRRQW